jgi:hypothetical protein
MGQIMAAGSFDLDKEKLENTLYVLVQRPQRAVQNWQDWSGALEFAQLFQLARLVSHNQQQFFRAQYFFSSLRSSSAILLSCSDLLLALHDKSDAVALASNSFLDECADNLAVSANFVWRSLVVFALVFKMGIGSTL